MVRGGWVMVWPFSSRLFSPFPNTCRKTKPNHFSRSRCNVCGCLDQHVSWGQLRGLSNNSCNMQDLCRKQPMYHQMQSDEFSLHLFTDITPKHCWSIKELFSTSGSIFPEVPWFFCCGNIIYRQRKHIPELQICQDRWRQFNQIRV